MLYPDFNDLVALKDRKSDLMHTSKKNVKSAVPGNHHSPFRGQGLEFDSVREYIPGDDIRNIDWRVTARTGSPHLKLFRVENERHIVICVDMNATMRFGTRNTFKSVQAARIAALLGWQGLSQQDRISGCLFGDVQRGIQNFAPQRTKKSFCSLLKTLSEPPLEQHHIPLGRAVEHISHSAHTGSLVYVISDFMGIDTIFQQEANLSKLSKKCDLVFISVNDAADKTLSPVGTIGFNFGNEKAFIDTYNASGTQVYAAQWNKSRQKLDEVTKKFKIPLIELTTESEIQRDLILGLKSISKRKRR